MKDTMRWSFFRELLNPVAMKCSHAVITLASLALVTIACAEGKEVPLLKPYEAPILAHGVQIGSMRLPAGSSVQIISDQGGSYLVRRGTEMEFQIPKDYITAIGKTSPPVAQPKATALVTTSPTATPRWTSALTTVATDPAPSQLQGIVEKIMAFFAYLKATACANLSLICNALGISKASSNPVGTPQALASKVIPLSMPSADKTHPAAAVATPPVSTPTVVDHFSTALASAKHTMAMSMSMNDAFRLADLEKAKAKAIREKKPLGFILVWETKGDFFNYSTDTRNSYGPSALLHFYKGFNNNVVLVFVRHENELGLVPPAVSQGFSGPDEGGWAPNMAVTDATAQEFIVEIPTSNQDGAGRDTLFADGAKKIDLWLSIHPDAVTKPQ
jgi:hypothetical protein